MFRPTRSPGFTLLELLVALAILALSLTAAMRVFGEGLRGAGQAEDYLTATALAQSDLARLGIETFVPLSAGNHVGRHDDRFTWELRITPLAMADAAAPVSPHAEIFSLRYTITWQDNGAERSFTLETIRLGSAAR